jgi:pimeloyl-ACP methyl ester carboxylesterase
MTNTLSKGYVPSPFGQLHFAECGTGEPVLMLHQTPRSWTEYRDVLPLVGAEHRAIAMDTLGFGASAAPEGPHSIERFADAAEALVDALGLDRFHLVGHHTGGVIAEAALNRFMVDALTVLDRVEEGHVAVRRFVMEPRLALITARTLAVCASGDHYSLPSLEKFAEALGCETRVLPGGHVPVLEQLPEEFSKVVLEWTASA